MKKLFGFGLAVIVNAILVGGLAWSLSPIPHGYVLITNLSY